MSPQEDQAMSGGTFRRMRPCPVAPARPRSHTRWPCTPPTNCRSPGGDRATPAVPSLQTTTWRPRRWGPKASWWVGRRASGWRPCSAPPRTPRARATPSSSTPSSAGLTSATAPSPSRAAVPPKCPQMSLGCPQTGAGWHQCHAPTLGDSCMSPLGNKAAPRAHPRPPVTSMEVPPPPGTPRVALWGLSPPPTHAQSPAVSAARVVYCW